MGKSPVCQPCALDSFHQSLSTRTRRSTEHQIFAKHINIAQVSTKLASSAAPAPRLAAISPLSHTPVTAPAAGVCVALGSCPLLYQIFAIKRSERPCPHSRLSVTRGLHISSYDTLTTLAFGKLQPRPHLSWSGCLHSSTDGARPHYWDGMLHSRRNRFPG